MADISNKALSILVGVAIVVSLFGLVISQKGAITSFATAAPEKSSQTWISALFTIVILLVAVNIYFYHQRNRIEEDIPISEQDKSAEPAQENIIDMQEKEQQIKQPVNEINDSSKSPQDQRPTRYSYRF